MRIDVHAHYFPLEYLERIDRQVGSSATAYLRRNNLASTGPHDLEAQLRLMDRARVDMQILSISSLFPYFANESDASNTARFANDIHRDIVREYPKRFAAFACTPLPHVQASIEEMRRALDDLGMVGVTAGTTVLGKSIADPDFVEFWVELNRRKAVLFIHPMGAGAASEAIEASNLTWPIGAPLEDTICMLQCMQAEIPKRFPEVKIVLPHLGGFAPFLMARFDELRDRFLPESAALPSVQAKSFCTTR